VTLPDNTDWPEVGATSNVRYYSPEPRILVGVAMARATDDRETGLENIKFHNQYMREHGPGVVIMCLDEGASQSREARQAYLDHVDPKYCIASAVVGSTLIARAMGTAFLQFGRLRARFKVFVSFSEAVAWAHEMIAEHEE
jgi:hypothetical protein